MEIRIADENDLDDLAYVHQSAFLRQKKIQRMDSLYNEGFSKKYVFCDKK